MARSLPHFFLYGASGFGTEENVLRSSGWPNESNNTFPSSMLQQHRCGWHGCNYRITTGAICGGNAIPIGRIYKGPDLPQVTVGGRGNRSNERHRTGGLGQSRYCSCKTLPLVCRSSHINAPRCPIQALPRTSMQMTASSSPPRL
jgi:hypothetical protein